MKSGKKAGALTLAYVLGVLAFIGSLPARLVAGAVSVSSVSKPHDHGVNCVNCSTGI